MPKIFYPFSWQAINAIVLVLSCASLAVLFPEIVYRDNYRNYKAQSNNTSPASESDGKSDNDNASLNMVITDINNRIADQSKQSIYACHSACNLLFRDQRSQQTCRDHINNQIKNSPDQPPVDGNTFPWLTKIQEFQQTNITEDDLYSKYITSKEIGTVFPLTNQLTGPHLFIMIFVFLGLAASSIGNLIIEAINKNLGRDVDSPPLNSLLLGPVVSCLVAAILVYIFTPSGEAEHYFSKKILDIPIAVYISSFLLSFSPINTVENIANFVFSQIKTITGSQHRESNGHG